MQSVIIFALSIGNKWDKKVFTTIANTQPNADIAISLKYSKVLFLLE